MKNVNKNDSENVESNETVSSENERKNQMENSPIMICRYGKGCTHTDDPIHCNKFFHGNISEYDEDELAQLYICNECGRSFDMIFDLQLHLQRKTAWSNESLIGCKISALLEKKEWHEGTVVRYNPQNEKHQIEFQGKGERRWMHMKMAAFFILDRGISPDQIPEDLQLTENNPGEVILEMYSQQIAPLESSYTFIESVTQSYTFAQSSLYRMYGNRIQETGHKTMGHQVVSRRVLTRSSSGTDPSSSHKREENERNREEEEEEESDSDGESSQTKEQRKKKVGKGCALLYGELLPRGVNKALSLSRLNAFESSSLFELGMGTGKVALQAFLQFPSLTFVHGVELNSGRFTIAEMAVDKLVKMYPSRYAVVQREEGVKIVVEEMLPPPRQIQKFSPFDKSEHTYNDAVLGYKPKILSEQEIGELDLQAMLCSIDDETSSSSSISTFELQDECKSDERELNTKNKDSSSSSGDNDGRDQNLSKNSSSTNSQQPRRKRKNSKINFTLNNNNNNDSNPQEDNQKSDFLSILKDFFFSPSDDSNTTSSNSKNGSTKHSSFSDRGCGRDNKNSPAYRNYLDTSTTIAPHPTIKGGEVLLESGCGVVIPYNPHQRVEDETVGEFRQPAFQMLRTPERRKPSSTTNSNQMKKRTLVLECGDLFKISATTPYQQEEEEEEEVEEEVECEDVESGVRFHDGYSHFATTKPPSSSLSRSSTGTLSFPDHHSPEGDTSSRSSPESLTSLEPSVSNHHKRKTHKMVDDDDLECKDDEEDEMKDDIIRSRTRTASSSSNSVEDNNETKNSCSGEISKYSIGDPFLLGDGQYSPSDQQHPPFQEEEILQKPDPTIRDADIVMMEVELPSHLYPTLCLVLNSFKKNCKILSYIDLKKVWPPSFPFPFQQLAINKSIHDRYPTSWSVQRGHHFFLWQKIQGPFEQDHPIVAGIEKRIAIEERRRNDLKDLKKRRRDKRRKKKERKKQLEKEAIHHQGCSPFSFFTNLFGGNNNNDDGQHSSASSSSMRPSEDGISLPPISSKASKRQTHILETRSQNDATSSSLSMQEKWDWAEKRRKRKRVGDKSSRDPSPTPVVTEDRLLPPIGK